MAKTSMYRTHGRVSQTPRRPYEKERQERELRIAGEYGLRNRREIWRVQHVLAKARATARQLLTLEEDDARRQFDGTALIRRLHRYGVLDRSDNSLNDVLSLSLDNFMERRLQTLVYKKKLANSIHHARCLIAQKHISVGNQIVDDPSFLVRVESERHIRIAETSAFGNGAPGRVRRAKQSGGDGGDEY